MDGKKGSPWHDQDHGYNLNFDGNMEGEKLNLDVKNDIIEYFLCSAFIFSFNIYLVGACKAARYPNRKKW